MEPDTGHERHGGAPKGLHTPVKPSKWEIEQHELTHIPYRDWCAYCVRARGIARRHMKADEEAKLHSRTVFAFAFDYLDINEDMSMIDKDEVRAGKRQLGKPIGVGCDRLIGGLFWASCGEQGWSGNVSSEKRYPKT